MPELLVKINDNINESLPSEEQGGLYKEGDVVVVMPDGWNWGVKERQNFLIVPIDEDLTAEEIQDVVAEEWEPRELREDEKGKVFRPNRLVDTPEEVQQNEDQFQAELLMAQTEEARNELLDNRPPERPVQMTRRRTYTVDVDALVQQEGLDAEKLKTRDVEYQPFVHPAGTIVEKKTRLATGKPLPGSPGMLMQDKVMQHTPTRNLQKKSLLLSNVLKRKSAACPTASARRDVPQPTIPGQKPGVKKEPVGKLIDIPVQE